MHPQRTVDEVRRLFGSGRTPREIARLVGVSERTIRHWCSGDRRGPDAPQVSCPRCTTVPLDEGRYAYLLACYLGDGHITIGRRASCLWIYCADDWPGIRKEVHQALREVMPSSSVSIVQRTGCVALKSYSTHWICLLPQHGSGMKHSRPIVLTPWQQEIVEKHPGQFLRGLFHSDGCRVTNWTQGIVAEEIKRYECSAATRSRSECWCRSLASGNIFLPPRRHELLRGRSLTRT